MELTTSILTEFVALTMNPGLEHFLQEKLNIRTSPPSSSTGRTHTASPFHVSFFLKTLGEVIEGNSVVFKITNHCMVISSY